MTIKMEKYMETLSKLNLIRMNLTMLKTEKFIES